MKINFKEYMAALEQAQSEFCKIPRSAVSGTRNGNACNAVVKRLAVALEAAGQEKNKAGQVALRVGQDFKRAPSDAEVAA